MKVERKAYETVIEFEPWDWGNGKAKRVIADIKSAGGKYYALSRTWHLSDKEGAERIINGLSKDNRVSLDGTEQYGEDFVNQFKDLP